MVCSIWGFFHKTPYAKRFTKRTFRKQVNIIHTLHGFVGGVGANAIGGQLETIISKAGMDLIPKRLDEELSPSEKERAREFMRYLQEHFENLQDEGEIPFSWTPEAAGALDVGFDPAGSALVYVQWDGGGEQPTSNRAVGMKWDGSTDGTPRLWPLNIRHGSNPGEPKWIVFVESERAAISLRCWRAAGVCSSGGIESLPDDLSWLSQYDRVVVVLNNDEEGWQIMLNLADAILQQCPDVEVLLYRWPAGTPSGFGILGYCEVGTPESFKRQVLEQAAVYRPPANGGSSLRLPSKPDRKRQSEEKVESALRSAGGVMDRTTLMRKTRLPKHDLDEALASLEGTGLVSVVSKPRERSQGGGRPVVVVSWVEK